MAEAPIVAEAHKYVEPPRIHDRGPAEHDQTIVDLSQPGANDHLKRPHHIQDGFSIVDGSKQADKTSPGEKQVPADKQVPPEGMQGLAGKGKTETVVIGKDGQQTKISSGPDGTVIENPNGSSTATLPDGSQITKEPETAVKDGITTKKYPYDNREEKSGFPDGRKETTWPDGHKETEYQDGHKDIHYSPNDPQGRESEVVSDGGNVHTIKYKDGHSEQVNDQTGVVIKAYPEPNGHTDTIDPGADPPFSTVKGYQPIEPVINEGETPSGSEAHGNNDQSNVAPREQSLPPGWIDDGGGRSHWVDPRTPINDGGGRTHLNGPDLNRYPNSHSFKQLPSGEWVPADDGVARPGD